MRLRAGTIDKAGDPLQLLSGNQRPQFGSGVVGRADLQGGDRLAQRLHQLFIHRALHIQAAGGGAILPGVVEAETANTVHHLLQVGVVKHNHRSFAAQLHVGAFHAGRCIADDMRTGGDRPGQRYHAHPLVAGQRIADFSSLTEQNIDHARREQVGQQAGQIQRRQRRLLRRLQHRAVSRRQRRGQLPRRHHQRVIPGGDRGDDADRIAANH